MRPRREAGHLGDHSHFIALRREGDRAAGVVALGWLEIRDRRLALLAECCTSGQRDNRRDEH